MKTFYRVFWMVITFIISINAVDLNQTQLCQSFGDGIQTRTNNSKIKFINHSYLFNNPDNILDGEDVINSNSNLSCRDINNSTDEACQSSNTLGYSIGSISRQDPQSFTLALPVTTSNQKIKFKQNGGVTSGTALTEQEYKSVKSNWYPNLSMIFDINSILKAQHVSTTNANSTTLLLRSADGSPYDIEIKKLLLKRNTQTSSDNLAQNIKIKTVEAKRKNSLTLTATTSISIEKLDIDRNSTVTIKAPRVTINNLKSFQKSTIKIIADEIDITNIRLKNRANLTIESYSEDTPIDMKIEKLKLQKAYVLLGNGLYHIKRIELKNRSSLNVDENVQIINRRVIVENHSLINASTDTPICDDTHNSSSLVIYSNDLVRVENSSNIVGFIYNNRRIELTNHSGIKGAISAKNRAILKNHSKVCYTSCSITPPPSVDTTPPVITLNGDANITLTEGEIYNELGATALDDVDGEIDVSISGDVNGSIGGIYTITYTATDSSNNSASKTRTVNITTHEEVIEELNEILEDDSIPYTTGAEFNQTEYANNHISIDEAKKLERAHMLVATAVDPEPEWFATKVDKKIVIAETGGDYTIHFNKAREDGTIIEPVDNDKLRLVVRIQRAKNDFEYITNVNIDQYAHWDGDGVLRIHVPDDLDRGRLIVGVRPNFDDVATTAIAERWSTFVMAEVWEIKTGVKTIDASSVLFPIDNNGSISLDTGSHFSKDHIGDKIRQKLEQNSTISLALVTVDTDLQNDELVSYIFNEKPYSGRVISVEGQGDQQLVLLKPEIFNIYEITEGDDNFMIKQGLSPENIIYREGISLSTDINQSDPVNFEKMMRKEEKKGFWSVDCTKGNSVLTYKPIFSLSPMDAGLQVSVYVGKEKTDCKWEANLKTLKLENMALATGGAPFVVIAKELFGSGGEISPYGELKLTVEHAPGFGIDAGWTFKQGANLKINALMKTIDGLGSRDIFDELKSSKAKAEISSNLGTKLKIKAISDTGLIGKAFSFFGIEVKDIGIEAKTGVKFATTVKANNAREVYDSGNSSEFVADISLNARIKTTHAFGFYMTMLGFDSWNDYKANISLAKVKVEAKHTFSSITDDGQGHANINELSLNSSFLNSILPDSRGVLAPTDDLSSVFNDHSEDISYELSECANDPEYKIEVPVIACAGWMCGEVVKPIKLCQGKLTISPIIADARVDKTASTTATIINKVGNITVDVSGSPLITTENSFSMDIDEEKSLEFSKKCPHNAGTYRGTTTIKANGMPFEDSVENIMVCHNDDTHGDPHIVTADGLGYDYFASGDYVLSRIDNISGYEIQARFLPGYKTSWPQAISLRVGNDIVEIQGVRRDGHGNSTGVPINALAIWVNGKKGILGNDNRFSHWYNEDSISKNVAILPSGGIIAVTQTDSSNVLRFASSITVIWPEGSPAQNYGVILSVAEKDDPFVQIQIARPNDFAGQERGLMGNNDGNPQNDFIRRNGEVLGVDHNMSFTELYALFGTDWLVKSRESLFRNPEAIKPEFPTDIITLTPEQRKFGEQACMALRGFYREACILDVGLTNSIDLVQEYYSQTEDLNELSDDIVTPDVDAAEYRLKAGKEVEFPESSPSKLYYSKPLDIEHVSGDGNFILSIRPPRGATAILDTGEENHIDSGDFNTSVVVDCRTENPETNSTLFNKIGAAQLWMQDPLSGTAKRLYGETKLYCRLSEVLKTGQTEIYSDFDDGYYQKGVSPSFTRDNSKEVVVDNMTKLVWQDNYQAKTVTRNLSGATYYCYQLSMGGYTDWRLPTISELNSLETIRNNAPRIHSVFINTASNGYLSSTLNVADTSKVWVLNFDPGYPTYADKSQYYFYVRCVRQGE